MKKCENATLRGTFTIEKVNLESLTPIFVESHLNNVYYTAKCFS